MKLRTLVPSIFLFTASISLGSNLRLSEGGIEVDAGPLGQFTIEYPSLLDAKQILIHPLVSKQVAGSNATLKYEGNGEVKLALTANGKIEISFVNRPGDVQSFRLEMHIPLEFNQGGTWKAGVTNGSFPSLKPAVPHFFSNHAASVRLTGAGGKSLVLSTPENSFVQLTDNREWNWEIYNLSSFTPLTETSDYTASIALEEPPTK